MGIVDLMIVNLKIDFYEKDAEMAHEFMKVLNVGKYSVLGWSDGGIAGMIMAAKYKESIRKLVIWGANSYVLPEELKSYESKYIILFATSMIE